MDYILTLLFTQPPHDLRVLCKQISTSVLIRRTSIAEIIRIFDVQNQKLIDLRLGQTCLFVQLMQGIVCRLAGPGTVLLVALPDDKIHRHPGLHYRLVGPVPLGGTLEIGSE